MSLLRTGLLCGRWRWRGVAGAERGLRMKLQGGAAQEGTEGRWKRPEPARDGGRGQAFQCRCCNECSCMIHHQGW